MTSGIVTGAGVALLWVAASLNVSAAPVAAGSSATQPAAASVPGERHDTDFWREFIHADFAIPEGESAAALIDELDGYLGSPDPELRDELGSLIKTRLIYRMGVLGPAELRARVVRLTANLGAGFDTPGDEAVLKRSFSALDLSILAASDLKAPYLDDAGYRALLDAAITYLGRETDLRGYVDGIGWVHATGHTADLLKFLARSDRFTVADQGRVLDAIATRLVTAGEVFRHGEDERLAAAARSVIARPDFAPGGLDRVINPIAAANQTLWTDKPLDQRKYAAVGNGKAFLRSLYVLLSFDVEPTPAVAAAKSTLLSALAQL